MGAVLGGTVAHAAALAGEVEGQFRGELRGEIHNEIADPCLGHHWQLVIDPIHPDWPGRLILLDQNAQNTQNTQNRNQSDNRVQTGPKRSVSDMQSMVIRAGDRVTVDQDSGVLDARFEAVALESAWAGEKLRVRLIVAGRRQGQNSELNVPGPVIPVVATGIGLARWTAFEQITGPVTGPVTERATDRPTERIAR
jgi:hypothetical protein